MWSFKLNKCGECSEVMWSFKLNKCGECSGVHENLIPAAKEVEFCFMNNMCCCSKIQKYIFNRYIGGY